MHTSAMFQPILNAIHHTARLQVAMDLSNLGIAYRALGRADIANGLFERAYKLMLNAVGPDDPKSKAIERNLS